MTHATCPTAYCLLKGKIPLLKEQSDIHQGDHNRYLNKRSYDSSKRFSRINAEDSDGYSDGSFEIVACRSERQRRRLFIAGS
ncbi:MAG: hypothetical protein MZV63_14085 [Marinilabiliales bacterium]|nr:hypothetical protein [Marinilabiliales bacterium]